MKSLTRYLIFILVFVLLLVGAWWMGYKTSFVTPHIEESKELVLERVQKVTKLVAVEGYFSEMYDHKDYKGYDWGILRKKAMIRVKAKVSMGYDFEEMKIETNEKTRTLTITKFPEPSIIAIDHDLDYFDITDGIFNRFDEADYNRLNERAKSFIESKALESSLTTETAERETELIEMLKFICKGMGWELKIEKHKDEQVLTD